MQLPPQSAVSSFLSSISPSSVYNFYFGGSATDNQKDANAAGQSKLNSGKGGQIAPGDAGAPAPAIAQINGKIVVQSNVVPWFLRELARKFNASGPWTTDEAAAFFLFLQSLQAQNVTTQAGLWAALNLLPESNSKTAVTAILLRMKVL